MASTRFLRLMLRIGVLFEVVQIATIAVDTQCLTNTFQEGLCVPAARCAEIVPVRRRSICPLQGAAQGMCCKPDNVIPAEASKLLPERCGQSSTDRMSGGNLTEPFQYPWMALLRYNIYGRIVDGCGGTLISERYVLTAAHCIKRPTYMALDHVRLGEHTRNTTQDCIQYPDERVCADPVEDFGIESTVIHERYDSPSVFSNDIGLIRLSRNVDISADHIKPICLPLTNALRVHSSPQYIVTGWGATENSTGSNILLEAILPRVENSICQERARRQGLRISLSENEMCAGGENLVDTCKGDSGGPVVYSSNIRGTRIIQFGIISHGANRCGKWNLPGIYVRVGKYVDWILRNMKP